MPEGTSSEAARLEELWSGEFGESYIERNRVLDERRGVFWKRIVTTHPIASVLEVGCGQGGNLRPLSRLLDAEAIWGVDVNETALEIARMHAPGIHAVRGLARSLPIDDASVDLAFTVGVLIHQPDATLDDVLAEVVRVSRRFVLWAEYHAPETEEVPYHGVAGSLFRRDYGSIYRRQFPNLVVRDEGYLAPEDGFDRLTWQLLEKSPSAASEEDVRRSVDVAASDLAEPGAIEQGE
ncbi:MAG TPA: pseudaminic acid biosynthesis-associated methylase [Candidatus Limnocylindrales bacterium]|nr:pseudaminic acid biosynthesis-associated methylase [Candidatus Limnocylindrales bacterium]